MIFAVSVHQAEEIAGRIKGAVVVTGETKDRAAIIEAFTAGEIPCIVNCMVFTEGTDIPRVETVIVARPTQSESLYCLDEQTEVLTANGWKNDISIGENVAAFDIQTGEVRFVPALAKGSNSLPPQAGGGRAMTRKRLPNGLLRRALLTEDFSDLTPAEIAEVFCTSAKSVRKTIGLLRWRWHWTHGPVGNDPLFIKSEYRCNRCGKIVYLYKHGQEAWNWAKMMGNYRKE